MLARGVMLAAKDASLSKNRFITFLSARRLTARCHKCVPTFVIVPFRHGECIHRAVRSWAVATLATWSERRGVGVVACASSGVYLGISGGDGVTIE